MGLHWSHEMVKSNQSWPQNLAINADTLPLIELNLKQISGWIHCLSKSTNADFFQTHWDVKFWNLICPLLAVIISQDDSTVSEKFVAAKGSGLNSFNFIQILPVVCIFSQVLPFSFLVYQDHQTHGLINQLEEK